MEKDDEVLFEIKEKMRGREVIRGVLNKKHLARHDWMMCSWNELKGMKYLNVNAASEQRKNCP